MIKNKKIAQYMEERTPRVAKKVRTYINFFAENYDEFDRILKKNDKYAFESQLKKYEKLAAHIARKHGLYWKNGGEIPPAIVRNLHKLGRREKEAYSRKHLIPAKNETVFKIYCPDD